MTLAPEQQNLPATQSSVGTSQGITSGSGRLLAIGAMSDAEFENNLKALTRAVDRITKAKLTVMKSEVDFGIIPGTKKPTLLQPGAQKLCMLAGLVPSYEATRTVGRDEIEPDVHYIAKCRLHFGSTDSPAIAEGLGSANSYERKYRYHSGTRTCPVCGAAAIYKSRYPDRETNEKGWYCNAKKDGCGEQFLAADERIIEQEVGNVENNDPYDQDNTLLKMAAKRAFISATLVATASSGDFTQDLEDNPEQAERDALTARLGIAARALGIDKARPLGEEVARVLNRKGIIDPRTLKTPDLQRVVVAFEDYVAVAHKEKSSAQEVPADASAN
jgi:hypothetical protein